MKIIFPKVIVGRKLKCVYVYLKAVFVAYKYFSLDITNFYCPYSFIVYHLVCIVRFMGACPVSILLQYNYKFCETRV
jgi:hypothetical protein